MKFAWRVLVSTIISIIASIVKRKILSKSMLIHNASI